MRPSPWPDRETYRVRPEWHRRAKTAADRIAELRRRGLKGTTLWNLDADYHGFLGQELVGMLTGQRVDYARETSGRGHAEDFPGVDVKTSLTWLEPVLRVKVRRVLADWFVLVALDFDWWPEGRIRVAGHASRAMVAAAPIVDRGNRGWHAHELPERDTLPGLPRQFSAANKSGNLRSKREP